MNDCLCLNRHLLGEVTIDFVPLCYFWIGQTRGKSGRRRNLTDQSHKKARTVREHFKSPDNQDGFHLQIRSNSESFIVAALFFLANLISYLRSNLLELIPIIEIPSSSSAADIRKAWGLGDAGSLLEVALTWSKFEQLDGQTQNWIPGFWTLGMSVLEVPLIWLERIGVPFFFSLLFVNLSLWAAIVYLIWKFYSFKVGRIPTMLGILVLSISWDFNYMLRDYVFYTESMGYGMLFTGLILFSLRFYFPHLRTNLNLLLAGGLLGSSLMFRHTSDSGLWALIGVSTFFYFKQKREKGISSKLRNGSKSKRRVIKATKIQNFERSNQNSRDLFFFGLIALLTTMPWRVMRSIAFNHFSLSLSGASVYVPRILWTTPESPGGMMYGWNGGNWACLINRVTCQDVQTDIENVSRSNDLLLLAIKTAFLNPIEFTQIRLEFLIKNWIPGFNWVSSSDSLVATIFFLLPLAFLIMGVKFRKSLEITAFIPWICFLAMHSSQLLITHYESRYFISIRILFIGILLNMLLSKDSNLKRLMIKSKGQNSVSRTT